MIRKILILSLLLCFSFSLCCSASSPTEMVQVPRLSLLQLESNLSKANKLLQVLTNNSGNSATAWLELQTLLDKALSENAKMQEYSKSLETSIAEINQSFEAYSKKMKAEVRRQKVQKVAWGIVGVLLGWAAK